MIAEKTNSKMFELYFSFKIGHDYYYFLLLLFIVVPVLILAFRNIDFFRFIQILQFKNNKQKISKNA